MNSGLLDAKGESIFTDKFTNAYNTARTEVTEKKSIAPILALLKKTTKLEEIAELQLSIGLIYNQQTGIAASDVSHICFSTGYSLFISTDSGQSFVTYNFP